MKTPLTIAIYSGVIPSTTFIENVIKEVAKSNNVLIFGTIKKRVSYESRSIQIIDTPTKPIQNILITTIRALKLLVKRPRFLKIAIIEATSYSGFYEKWIRFSRFVPVLLHRPEIFHLQWATEINRWVFLKEAYGCKLVVSLLGTQINISPKVNLSLNKMYQDYFKEVDAFQSISFSLKKELIPFNIPNSKTQVIRTPIASTTFNYYDPTYKKSNNEVLKLVSVGRYHWVKGYVYALKALRLLLNNGVKASYTIIAPNEATEELRFMVNDLNLKEHVLFKSAIPQFELFELLKSFDLMLVSSVSEGIANVAVEAMAVGLPVLSTDCGGMSEVIVHNETGWLVPIRNPSAMAATLHAFNEMPNEAIRKVKAKAYQKVCSEYHIDTVRNQFDEFYCKVIERKEFR